MPYKYLPHPSVVIRVHPWQESVSFFIFCHTLCGAISNRLGSLSYTEALATHCDQRNRLRRGDFRA